MKNPKLPSLVAIAILTVITSVFWLGFSVYRIFSNKPSPAIPPEILEPLNPSLDSDLIGKVESRVFFTDSQIPERIAVSSPSPTLQPTATPTPLASPSATPAIPATQSGTTP